MHDETLARLFVGVRENVHVLPRVTRCIKCARRTQKPQKTSKSEEMSFLVSFFLYFAFNCRAPLSHCQYVLGPGSVISLGGPSNSP